MSKHVDAMGTRMKGYENCYRIYLPKRSAVIVRVDMRAGHSYTKGFLRPYDTIFAKCMQYTALKLCENISGAAFGYCQSDEISIALIDYKDIKTEPWFGNNLQKIVSLTASMSALFFKERMEDIIFDICNSWSSIDWENKEEMQANRDRLREQYGLPSNDEEWDQYVDIIQKASSNKYAMFDSRVFVIPREEVANYFYWRETDCVRNSIQLLGQANFSHNQLQNKNCDEIQEMLWQEHGINWSKEPEWFKNGVAIYKKPMKVTHVAPDDTVVTVERNKWFIDKNIPIFTQDRNFINKHIEFKG